MRDIRHDSFTRGEGCGAQVSLGTIRALQDLQSATNDQRGPRRRGNAGARLHNIPEHRQIIMGTFSDLGTYAQSLVSEGGGLYRPREDNPRSYLLVLDQVIQDRETAVIAVQRRLGDVAATWISPQDVLDHLVTAYQRLAQAEMDSRAPIVHAANAVESFLAQLAAVRGVNVANAPGLNAKVEALANGHHLTTKHKFILKYLGHVRNAADHGIDAEIGHQWNVPKTRASSMRTLRSRRYAAVLSTCTIDS